MRFLYITLFSVMLTSVNLVYIKNFQLENYSAKKYLKNIIKFNFSIGNKNKLKITKRATRTIFLGFLFNYLILFLIIFYINSFLYIFLSVFAVFILSPFLVVVPFLVGLPFEQLIKQRYIFLAKRKLKKCGCKKIAITGSYGKTSTKNILFQILKDQFNVCITPKSFNTPMGICKTILQELKQTDDFFVVEMGARKRGDIKFLSKFVGVDFGIITPVGNCHLQTFGTIENLENTKYELCENTSGVVIFNGRSKSTQKLFCRYPYKKFLVCTEDGFAYAKDVVVDQNGSRFTLCIDKSQIECKTKLLGKSSIDNVVVASAMAYVLGVSLVQIKNAIGSLKPTPHRLELIKGRVNVIDDSYNSNIDGFCEAVEVLSKFKGRKIVVSPGIVELGKKQFEINYLAGEKVADVADIFIIENETNKKSLFAGAFKAGMKKEKILFASGRKELQGLLKSIIFPGDNILFENDFPDNIK